MQRYKQPLRVSFLPVELDMWNVQYCGVSSWWYFTGAVRFMYAIRSYPECEVSM